MFFYFNYIRRFLYIYEENRKHEQSRKNNRIYIVGPGNMKGCLLLSVVIYTHTYK